MAAFDIARRRFRRWLLWPSGLVLAAGAWTFAMASHLWAAAVYVCLVVYMGNVTFGLIDRVPPSFAQRRDLTDSDTFGLNRRAAQFSYVATIAAITAAITVSLPWYWTALIAVGAYALSLMLASVLIAIITPEIAATSP